MAKKERSAAKSRQKAAQKHENKPEGRSIAVLDRGIRLGPDAADLMIAVADDAIRGIITASVGNVAINAINKVLKIHEMTLKYGGGKPIRLAGPPTA